MSSEMNWVRLRDLSVRITKGTTPTKGEGFVSRGVNYIKSESITDDGAIDKSKFAFINLQTHTKLLRSQLRAGNVLFSMAGMYLGKTAVVLPEHVPANTNQAVGVISLDESKADPYFVHYSLRSPACRAWVLSSAAQSAQPNFNLQEIGNLKVPAIPLVRQKEIASILRTLDDRITLLRETNKTLESIAQAIFKSWFVDFDPVRAKMEGRQPEGMDAETAALFPVSFDDSALGPIPHGWEISTLSKSCSELKRGISPKYVEDRGVLVLNQKCVRDFAIDFAKARRHDIAQRKVEGRTVELGDVLVNSTGVGTLGRVAPVLDLPEVTIVDSHLTMIRGGPSLKPTYLGEWMQRSQPIIEAMGEGTTGQTELSRSKLGELRILLPPEHVQERFDQLIKPLKSRIVANRRTETNLAELRDSLLPRLVSGRLRLPEAKERVESSSQ